MAFNGKKRGKKGQEKKGQEGIIKRCSYWSGQGAKEEAQHIGRDGAQDNKMGNRYGPGVHGAAGKGGEDKQDDQGGLDDAVCGLRYV